MHTEKLHKLLFFLSQDARINTKKLGQALNCSQQTASYTTQHLHKKKIIQNYQTIVDPAKFSLINVILLINYQDFNPKTTKAIQDYLLTKPHIVRIEATSQGADLLVEYCVPNLSYFNKQHKAFLYTFSQAIQVTNTYVVIVKHHYTKNYLHKNYKERKEYVISGDRDSETLTRREQEVLLALIKEPTTPLIRIARIMQLDPKTINHIKKRIEQKNIIRGYSITLNQEQLHLIREHLFIELNHRAPQEEKRFLAYCAAHKNIIAVTKTLGTHDVFITTERTEKDTPIITDLRQTFTIKSYQILGADKIHKYTFLPQTALEP